MKYMAMKGLDRQLKLMELVMVIIEICAWRNVPNYYKEIINYIYYKASTCRFLQLLEL